MFLNTPTPPVSNPLLNVLFIVINEPITTLMLTENGWPFETYILHVFVIEHKK